MNIYYLGAFPIEGGGVTIKNRDLFYALSGKGLKLKKIDLNKITRHRSVWELLKFVFVFLNPKNKFVIGISTGVCTRRTFSKLFYIFNKRAMSKSIILIMGGTDAHTIAMDEEYRKWVRRYKMVYVETSGMLDELRSAGMTNCALYPNGRFKPEEKISVKDNAGKLRCVFFSYIRPEKGADIVLSAAAKLSNVDFAFYGSVYEAYKEDFENNISRVSNAIYKGNFKGTPEQVYRELGNYDILILPTRYKTEGVPGILVEAKIAGITSIVSNESHNAEIVSDGKDGVVLRKNDEDELIRAISELDVDRAKLQQLKEGSFRSANNFYIENYIDGIVETLVQQ